MTADDAHSELIEAWRALLEVIDGLPGRIRSGDTQYDDLTNMADRARGLGMHLDAAVGLAGQHLYPSALALLRTALEHCVVDWLLFQGRTLVQRYSGVDDTKWRQWQTDREAGAEWTATIKDWTRTKKGDVRIVREGLFSEPDERGRRFQISIYYFLIEQYRPTLGTPGAIRSGDRLLTTDQLRRMAGENEVIWRVYLTWSSLLTNLQENSLVDGVDAGRLAAHYRYLSGHAHPVVDQRKSLYGRNVQLGWPKYDHFSGELVLLYAIAIALLEVRNFVGALSRRPDVTLAGLPDLEQSLAFAESVSSYFWFLGERPHAYDIWSAHNDACFHALQEGGIGAALPAEPAPEDVPYPPDPLRRLVAMHSTVRELMTGLVYVSPWPRDDALLR